MKHECKGVVNAIFWASLFTDTDPKDIQAKARQRLTELDECTFCGEKLEKPLQRNHWYLIERSTGEKTFSWFGDEDKTLQGKILRGPLDMDRWNEFPVRGQE